jgi:hypothetical protein
MTWAEFGVLLTWAHTPNTPSGLEVLTHFL